MSIYPIAEVFSSLQGEGNFVGYPMAFIRFAGCNVGKPLEAGRPLYPLYTRCQAAVGASFICDTNYQASTRMGVSELIDFVKGQPAKAVCLTGGEPLLHDLSPLVERLKKEGYTIHLETSGTLPIPRRVFSWVACSPKLGFLGENVGTPDEYKFLIEATTPLDAVDKWLMEHLHWEEESLDDPVHPFIYLQPINGLSTLDMKSIQRCREIQERHHSWPLSVQLHKVLGVR